MKIGKPKSKRTPVRLRHKIEKASAAKQRKQRKEAKSNPQWRSRLKKDPGIPNLFPYKAKVLAEIEESRRKKEEDVLRRKEIAKAQRQGNNMQTAKTDGGDEVDDLLDDIIDADVEEEEDEDDEDDDIMDVQDDSNPMAALLASAQARAQAYNKGGEDNIDMKGEGKNDEDGVDEDDDEWNGIQDSIPRRVKESQQQDKKPMPKRALEDPIATVTKLITRMESTEGGIQPLMDHYQIPPLVTTGNGFVTRYLVEVARKRGRLGKGGVPNLHSAALTVLSDLHEDRLRLPVLVETAKTTTMTAASGKGQVQIVTTMAQPFKLEGLWGDEITDTTSEMVVE